MRPILVLAAGEVITLSFACRRLTSRHDTLGSRPDEIFDADAQAVANALHDVERRRDLVVFNLGEIRDGDARCLAHLRERAIERTPDLLESCSELICLCVHCRHPRPPRHRNTCFSDRKYVLVCMKKMENSLPVSAGAHPTSVRRL